MSREAKLEPVAGLVFDNTLYPRHAVDERHVRAMVEALEADQNLPDIVACAETDKIIDGVHRQLALVRMHGDKARWRVRRECFADDRERLLRAVALNHEHGLPLSSYDRAHCAVIAERLRVSTADLAAAFGVKVPAFERITSGRTAKVAGAGHRLAPKPCETPVKRSIRHMAGKVLTPRQEKANEKLSGWPPRFHADQLIELMEADLIDREDEVTIERLGLLSKKLSEFLATP